MGTTLLVVVPLLATTALLLLSVATVAEAGFIQAPELTKLRICDGQPCLISLLRQKRQDPPPADSDPAAPAAPPPGDAPADSPPPDAAPAAPAAPAADPAAPTGSGSGGSPATPPAVGLGDIPLPPVTQQMPNLPPNFPYPDVKVVQEVPIPTKPRKKLLPGGGGGANTYPFPPIGPPIDPVSPPMEVPNDASMEPASPVEPEPVDPTVSEPEPIEKEPYPTPIKPDCKPGGGYGPPQDWRFPKARGHKKCPPSTNSATGNAVNYDAGNQVNSVVDNEVIDPEDVRVNLRTVERDDEAGAAGHTTVHPGGKGSATSVVCSMGTVLFAAVAYFLNVAI